MLNNNVINKTKLKFYQEEFKSFYLNKKITDDDIIKLIKFNSIEIEGLFKKINNNIKKRILLSIYFCPFILINQEYLSDKLKKILPIILKVRYENEIEELYYQFEEGYINNDEYLNLKKDLKQNYNINKKSFQKRKTMI